MDTEALSGGIKQPERDGLHKLLSNAELKSEWNLPLLPLYTFMVRIGTPLPLHLKSSLITNKGIKTFYIKVTKYSSSVSPLLAR
jgi:hypothetical protein